MCGDNHNDDRGKEKMPALAMR